MIQILAIRANALVFIKRITDELGKYKQTLIYHDVNERTAPGRGNGKKIIIDREHQKRQDGKTGINCNRRL
ncbi:MAG TPA: hypothetical protein VL098_06280 [Flavipsychrobacter sp.]|nr:hypothetical protein [Flavipsychrobacter sp.]